MCKRAGENNDIREQNKIDICQHPAPDIRRCFQARNGRNIRMLVMDPAAQDEEKQPRVVINPELTLSEDTVLSRQEGCLSVPLNYRADVQRAERVHLRYMDLDGKIVEEDLEGFPAIVIQHEADHLDGTLFIDRIGRLRRSLYDTRVKKWLKRKG